MPVVATHLLNPSEPRSDTLQIYNGLDVLLTVEVLEALRKLSNRDPETYTFERALQAPALDMMFRGFKVDEYERQESIKHIEKAITKLDSILQQYAFAVWGRPLNPRSTKQLLSFFNDNMKIPEMWTSKKGVKKLSMDRETLEKIAGTYFHTQPIVGAILAIRDCAKQLQVLETEIDPDGRMRTSYNIAGTETGRWSSSENVLGTGTNLQNLQADPSNMERARRRSIRRMFESDSGWKLCGIDLEQAESREVGWLHGTLFNDWTYLDACEAGDLHTVTCKLIWRDLPWTGNPKEDRKIAERIFYREYSYRDMAKRGGHGTSYYGTPFTMARHLKVPVKLMQDFQSSFFTAYPAMAKWHRWVAQQIQTRPHSLTTSFGRTRHFFGRPNDDTTLREAIAFVPQSCTGDRLNLALWRIWKHMPQVQLLAQVHDALYFQYPEDADEAGIISQALSLMNVELTDPKSGRKFTVPGEAKIGWNWGNFHSSINPNGLMKWKGVDNRRRQTGLDRVM